MGKEEVSSYIKNLKRLAAVLEQRQERIAVDYQKSLLDYQYKIDEYRRDRTLSQGSATKKGDGNEDRTRDDKLRE